MDQRADARHLLLGWLALIALWTLATWWLEGRIRTLLRPDAVVDRLAYVGIANLLVGLVGAALLVRAAGGPAPVRPDPSTVRVAVSVLVGAALGLGLLLFAGSVSDPWVGINAYAQVLSVTVAEVAVCWWALDAALGVWRPESKVAVPALAAVVGAVAFGPYHFAHSPPFDTWAMVGGLTVMGLVTGAFFAVSRDLYGTVVFHNFAGTVGVTNALERGGRLADYEQPRVATLITGAVAVVALVLLDVLVARGSVTRR